MSVNNKGTNFHARLNEGNVIGIWVSAIQHPLIASLGNFPPFHFGGNRPLPFLQHDVTITYGVLPSASQGVNLKSNPMPTPWDLTNTPQRGEELFLLSVDPCFSSQVLPRHLFHGPHLFFF